MWDLAPEQDLSRAPLHLGSTGLSHWMTREVSQNPMFHPLHACQAESMFGLRMELGSPTRLVVPG